MIRDSEFLLSGPFAQAALTSFFFMSGLNCFILLPLYVHRLGGTEGEIGIVQGAYSAIGILCQPVVGLWLDRVGRRAFMILGVVLLVEWLHVDQRVAPLLAAAAAIPVTFLLSRRVLLGRTVRSAEVSRGG